MLFFLALAKLQNVFGEDVFKPLIMQYQADVQRELKKYERLREMDIFVLDNSIRESTVGKEIIILYEHSHKPSAIANGWAPRWMAG